MARTIVAKGAILDLCSGSGEWSRPYREHGYRVMQIDLPIDVRLLHLPSEPIHGILAGPPCTVFATAGNAWPRTPSDYIDGLSVVDACLRLALLCRPEWWCLENPGGTLGRWLGSPALRFNPCDYGDPYTKLTQLWGNFTKPVPTPVSASLGSLMHHTIRDPTKRAITPSGFANAFFLANP